MRYEIKQMELYFNDDSIVVEDDERIIDSSVGDNKASVTLLTPKTPHCGYNGCERETDGGRCWQHEDEDDNE